MRARLGGLILMALTAPATAETPAPATLAGQARVPAGTFFAPPADAPAETRASGRFAAGPARVDALESVAADTGPLHGRRPTGLALPFPGQPLQGFSGLARVAAPDGSLYAIIDNGFGSRRNSPDALLYFVRMAPDWATGAVEIRETAFLRDPDRIVPFRLTQEGTAERYLTGADFDPESIQVIGDEVWIGDEFGPFLIRAGLDGRIRAIYPTMVAGAEARSPDNPALQIPAAAGTDYVVSRSGGFEGLALAEDGKLWGLLEKPLMGADGKPEGDFLRALEFDPAAGAWTGESFRFPLAEGATAIGDFNFVDATRALVIERDNGEGDASLECVGDPAPDCFPLPAKLKRVVLIDTADRDAEGVARRVAAIDLMDIADPEGLARGATAAARDLAGRFTFPFFTIESVRAMDETHILVGSDNNLPFSTGRALDRAADSEFILLSVPGLLAAR